MPVSMADLGRDRRAFVMPTSVGDIRITYRPYQMTPAREAEIERISAELNGSGEEDGEDEASAVANRAMMKLTTQFCEVVESTDMVGPLHTSVSVDGIPTGEELIPAGEPIPVKPEYVKYWSSFFIIQILEAVGNDIRPKKKRGNS